jgi:hypothetical protein
MDVDQHAATIERLLVAIHRALHIRPGSNLSREEYSRGFAAAWPGDGTHLVLDVSAGALLDQLYDAAGRVQDLAPRWEPQTLRGYVHDALHELAHELASPRAAALALAGRVRALPAERIVLLDVHGVRVDRSAHVAGVTFHPGHTRREIEDEYFDNSVEELVVRRIRADDDADTGFAEVRLLAEDAIAAASARLRVLVALCVIRQSLRTSDSLEQQLEYTAGVERTEHASFLTGIPGGTPSSYTWGHVGAGALLVDASSLERARARAGVRALEELAANMPAVPLGSRVDRVLRGAQLLGRSLDGDTDDRFLRRWSALEALTGSPRTAVTEGVVQRAAALLSLPQERASREAWLKKLYARRSQLSHGNVDDTPFDHDAVAFGCLCFDLLEIVAARSDTDIEAVFSSQ